MAKQALASLKQRVQEIGYYREAIALMEWDLRTGAPKRGRTLRADAVGALVTHKHELSTAPEVGEWLNELSRTEVYSSLSEVDQALVRIEKKEFDLMHDIPANLMHEYQILTSNAESVWEDAKEHSDFAQFKPYLENIVALKKKFVDIWGHDGTPYNRLLDLYEPGMTVNQIDDYFGALRKELVPLVAAIAQQGPQYDKSKFKATYPLESQIRLNLRVLETMGYDFTAGRLDTTVHPFETTLNRYDVRVTTRYDVQDLRDTLFGTIHEGGHALYEQGVDPALIGTSLCSGTSMGIHESQSRFWENMVGRSLPFWQKNYGSLQEAFPNVFNTVSVEEYYRWINHVEPSLIRIESDEVTYNLHIMVRYEIEKGLFDGSYKVADLPEIWRQKMSDYLGIQPETDALGVLQDVHWAGGDFGYFPSYALGNLYAAQFGHALKRDIPDVDDVIRRGDQHIIREWLRVNIHQYGKTLEPAQIVQRVTGEPLSGSYLVTYLKEKYLSIYSL